MIFHRSEGRRLANTAPGPATCKDARIVVVDDPFNAVYDRFKGQPMTCFDNPAEGAAIVAMQRLHQDDPAG